MPVTLTREVDATEFVALRERLLLDPASQAARPTYTDLLLSTTVTGFTDADDSNNLLAGATQLVVG